MIIKQRTFEAKKHPVGSDERKRLNCNALTSEYMPSYRYQLCNDDGTTLPYSYRTKTEAEIRVRHNSGQ